MTTIAPLTPADRDDWRPLWQGYLDFYETPLTPELTDLAFRRLTDPQVGMHGALARGDDGRALGLVHWLTHGSTWADGSYCYLEDLYVDPAARAVGTGRALIAHVRDWAAAAGCAKVYWHTQATNATARALYDKVAADTGFVQYAIAL